MMSQSGSFLNAGESTVAQTDTLIATAELTFQRGKDEGQIVK